MFAIPPFHRVGLRHWAARFAVCAGCIVFLANSRDARADCPVLPQWIQTGPGPLFVNPPNGTDGQGPDSGMVRDLVIDPSGTTDSTIYIGTDSGGVWKTVDGGNTWLPKTDFMPSLNIGAVALDPGNPSIVYAGTGNELNQFVSSGVGIYKSTDAGETWTVLGNSIFSGLSINRIVLPAPGLVLVASSSGVFRSIDGGANFGNDQPLFKNGLPVIYGDVTDLDIDTASPTTVYASLSGVGIFKSVDSGVTFPSSGNLFTGANGSPTSIAYITLAQSTQPNNQTMYVQVQLLSDPANAGVFKSINGGASWNRISVSTSDIEVGEVGYAQTIGVDPQDANRLFVGSRSFYMVSDGGASGVTSGSRIDLKKVHADQHALVFSPASHFTGPAPTRVFTGTDGGIGTTANPGPNATWTMLNGSAACVFGNGSLATVLFRQIDIGRGGTANNQRTYGVAQDLGVSAHQPNCVGTSWLSGSGGDGNSISVDPLNAQHALAGEGGGMAQTTDGGQSWPAAGAGLPAGAVSLVYFDPSGGTAYAVPNNNLLYQSTDNGANFLLAHLFSANVSSLTMSRSDPNTVWVGLANGSVERTVNALTPNSTWAFRNVPGSPANTAVAGIALDPFNTDQAVVAYRGGAASVFLTMDGGNSWANISPNVAGLVANAVVIDPNTSPHAIVVATDTGVLSSMDSGKTWAPLGQGLPNVHCTSLAIDSTTTPSMLRVGTYGRSTFELAYDRVYVDSRNASGPQDGTIEHPWGTVLQGLNSVISGASRVINIQTADYAEAPLTINQCCTLNALYGPVTIH
jgi:photosystem II stability/assembly factor-like uncharacterized protein